MDGLAAPESYLLHLLVEAAVLLVVAAVGAGLVVWIRRRVLPRSEVLSVTATALVVGFFSTVLLNTVGVDLTGQAWPLLLVPGFLLGHSRPRSVRALCRTLALLCGVTAGYAFVHGQFLGAAVALGITGGLVVLADHARSAEPVSVQS